MAGFVTCPALCTQSSQRRVPAVAVAHSDDHEDVTLRDATRETTRHMPSSRIHECHNVRYGHDNALTSGNAKVQHVFSQQSPPFLFLPPRPAVGGVTRDARAEKMHNFWFDGN